MRHKLLPVFVFGWVLAGAPTPPGSGAGLVPAANAAPAAPDFVVLPDPTNGVQLRLYTNASPDAAHLFNTFELEANGAILLPSLGPNRGRDASAKAAATASLHHILVDGTGPELAATNGMTVIDRASGPEWRYLALDASAAYRGRLQQFRRAILFVEPDLFVVYDHLAAPQPVGFQMLLHPPAATLLDTNWGDLRLDLPRVGMRIHTPSRKGATRLWQRIESPADAMLPGTATMQLGPTNKLAQIDLLTVFAVYPGGAKADYVFKLLESNSAIGARIHRAGLPTLIAFRTDPAAGSASLTGFGFNGPVGVSVFRPKPQPKTR